ncbi:MAG: hypothetical protein KKA79_09605 [Nanoarchaeota archaeon]|nr:hypothetical protein [Nanoarchaeota archaeon]
MKQKMPKETPQKRMFNPTMIQEIMNISAMELMQENKYVKKFAEDIKEIRKRLQEPRQRVEDIKRIQKDREEYAKKFQEDVKRIRNKVYA